MSNDHVDNHLLENVINKIISAYPYLEVEKNNIIANVLKKDKDKDKEAIQKNDKTGIEYVLYKFTNNDQTLYRDQTGAVWDENVNLVGVIRKQLAEDVYDVEFFNKKVKKYNLKEMFPEFII